MASARRLTFVYGGRHTHSLSPCCPFLPSAFTDKTLVRRLLAASLSAANLSYAAQQTLFAVDAPERIGLAYLGAQGMGSDTTIAADVVAAIEHVEHVVAAQ